VDRYITIRITPFKRSLIKSLDFTSIEIGHIVNAFVLRHNNDDDTLPPYAWQLIMIQHDYCVLLWLLRMIIMCALYHRATRCYNVSSIMQIIRHYQYATCLPTIVLLITIESDTNLRMKYMEMNIRYSMLPTLKNYFLKKNFATFTVLCSFKFKSRRT